MEDSKNSFYNANKCIYLIAQLSIKKATDFYVKNLAAELKYRDKENQNLEVSMEKIISFSKQI